MNSTNTKSNHEIGQESNKVSPHVRKTFIQAIMRKKQKYESIHCLEIRHWSTVKASSRS